MDKKLADIGRGELLNMRIVLLNVTTEANLTLISVSLAVDNLHRDGKTKCLPKQYQYFSSIHVFRLRP